ncbi:transglycosylase family protein, partial [Frankia sp. EI5c]|uniref:transglycosylase family protein n=1 Tax=Frankia sp. EI5c TaxID=683316 RepID=UPI001F5B153D
MSDARTSGRQRRSSTRSRARKFVPVPVLLAAVGGTIAMSQPANAATTWEGLRQCESGGNYTANTGNGYHGAYQFSPTTWRS